MPIYEYRCLKCGERKDIISSFKDRKAPRCCKRKMKEVINKPNVIAGACNGGNIA